MSLLPSGLVDTPPHHHHPPAQYTTALSSSVQYANVCFAVGCSRFTSLDNPNNRSRNGPCMCTRTYTHAAKVKLSAGRERQRRVSSSVLLSLAQWVLV